MFEREANSRDLYEKAPLACFTVSADRMIKDCNNMAPQMLGYGKEELIDKDIIGLLGNTPSDKKRGEEIWDKALKGEVIRHARIRLVRKDGSLAWGSLALNTLHDKDGKIIGCRCMVSDITEYVTLEAQLQQAAKMEAVGTLAGGIAHDFNNLLMGIQGNVSLLLMHMDSTHPHYTRLKRIEEQVGRGTRLTSHLLGYARSERYEVKPLSLNQLAEQTAYAFGRTKRGITIHLDLAKDLLAIEADQGQIEQVFLNLFINASDAMPHGGNLVLKTINVTHRDMPANLVEPKPGNYVLLSVADTGIGMDKETMDRIYDPFFTTKQRGLGTGLGLASAYGITKSYGGYVVVDSKEGKGTTFSIYLPASERQARRVVRTADQVIRGTETVLLVDDEKGGLEVGKELLEVLGYRVLTATNGKEALEVYEDSRDAIDIVLLDLVMPKMGGGEAYDRLKRSNPEIKVLLLSGHSMNSEANDVLQRGCNAFIQKPFNAQELSHKIREVLDKE